MTNMSFCRRSKRVCFTLIAPSAFVALLCTSGSAFAQVTIGGEGAGEISAICSADGRLYVTVDSDDCGGGLDFYPEIGLRIGSPTTGTTFANNGTATFNAATTTFNGVVSASIANGGLVSTGRLEVVGATTLNTLSVTNRTTMTVAQISTLSVTNDTSVGALQVINNTLMRGGLTVNHQAMLNGGAAILGTTNVQTMEVAGGLAVAQGATVEMGGNRIQNVGSPATGTDAANKTYVDVMVASVATDVTTLNDQVNRQETRIAEVEDTNAAQDARLGVVESENGTQNTRLASIETKDISQDVRMTAIDAKDVSQDSRMTAIEVVNTTQSNQISTLRDDVGGLQTSVSGLRRNIREANGGIAAAVALGGTMIVPDSAVSISFNLATYRGQQGFSGSVVGRISPKVYVNAGVGGSTVRRSTAGRIGISSDCRRMFLRSE
jgi:hypothetical protein